MKEDGGSSEKQLFSLSLANVLQSVADCDHCHKWQMLFNATFAGENNP